MGLEQNINPQPILSEREKLMQFLPFHGWAPGLSGEVEGFVDNLRNNREQVLQQIDGFLSKPASTGEEVALKVYLNTTVKAHVFDIDTLTGANAAATQIREEFACMSTDYIAQDWLRTHPDSVAAQNVVDSNIYAPSGDHHNLLYEMWPYILGKINS